MGRLVAPAAPKAKGGDAFHRVKVQASRYIGVRYVPDVEPHRAAPSPVVRVKAFEAKFQARRAELAPVVRGPQLEAFAPPAAVDQPRRITGKRPTNRETRESGNRVVVSLRLSPKLLARLASAVDSGRAAERGVRVLRPLGRTFIVESAITEWLDRNEDLL